MASRRIVPVLLSIAASLLPVGCVDYSIEDPDALVPTPVMVEDRFVQAPLPAVDVLFVVDGTGSMAEEQAAFADAADGFVDTLADLGLSYQLGVTTADPGDDGALVGRPWIITAAADDPSAALADALVVGTDATAPAAGLYAATRALADGQGLNRGFRRPNAGLHVVFVSDGDDESDTWLTSPAADFLAWLDAEAEASGRAARASALVGDVPGGCSGATGTARPGARYVDVAEASGGVVASICAADFTSIAAALGDAAVEWPSTFALSTAPVAESVRVTVDGARVETGWSLDPAPALVFDAPPAPDAVVVVSYTAAEAP